jgi:hypothetical protein
MSHTHQVTAGLLCIYVNAHGRTRQGTTESRSQETGLVALVAHLLVASVRVAKQGGWCVPAELACAGSKGSCTPNLSSAALPVH